MSATAEPKQAFALPPVRLQFVIMLSALALIGVFLAIESPIFFRPGNLINVVNQASVIAILAMGMSVVMLAGGIDLSLPANMALSGILGSMAMIGADSVFLGCLVMMASGMAIGALNGLAVARLRMIPFVVTLAMMTVCGGLSVWLTNSVSISNQPERYFDAFLVRLAGLPVAIYIMLATVIVVQLVMSFTRFGWHVYAVGTNANAANISRVPVKPVLFQTYVLAGAMAGLAAIVITARLGSASANVGNDNVILDVITACVVGGVSIYGGIGRPIGAMLGAIFVVLLSNVFNLLAISFFIGLMVKGVIIIAFVALDRAFAHGSR